ncbi:MAG: NAD(P)/FAD-dependent oxidoreductase [Deltaproteobacteria bacterium]|nr:NAD(P)/FAD-dependent oxidoreductase [Deltaproteobacteria bacterium]MBW2143560.1 NAD(P)/FAD-dependent oxidoreductase [Deltaproteobacteria bacterium]
MADYDAIVVGAGHNGLSAATILAKNGLSVLCVEKTNGPGGMAATKELFEGFKHNVGAWAMIVFRDKMLELLELQDYGIELIRPRSSYCVFGAPEDAPFIGYTDVDEMTEHLMNDHGPDAVEGLAGFADYLQKFKALVDEEMFKAPRSLESLIAGAPDAETREILLKTVYGSAMGILRQFFPDPEKHRCILGSLCASAIDGTHMGPFTPGTGLSLAYHYTMGDEYDFRTPKGGIGALSEAIAKSVEDRGGKIQYNTRVKRFLIENGKLTGVELKSGEKITARVVLSSLDARTTFIDLVGEDHLPSDFVHAVKEIEYKNGYIQIHMTLKELPEFTGHLAFANENNIRWLMTYIPSAEHLSRNWEQYQRGQVPDDPVSYCGIPSLMDPSLAPEGYYTCTIFSHYFPWETPKGKHKEMRDLMADRAIGQIAKYAPNFRDAIMDKTVLTQTYFENTFNVTAGDFASGLLHPGQMWDKRPVQGWANYRTPIESLFMCGSACHPGPGVTCVPGYNGAREVLKELNG